LADDAGAEEAAGDDAGVELAAGAVTPLSGIDTVKLGVDDSTELDSGEEGTTADDGIAAGAVDRIASGVVVGTVSGVVDGTASGVVDGTTSGAVDEGRGADS
jgi:hypothetical protein